MATWAIQLREARAQTVNWHTDTILEAMVAGGKHPNDLPQFSWINTLLLGNLKTSLSGTFHAFNVGKYARRYLDGNCFRFNRRFSLAAMTERIANAVCCCRPCSGVPHRVTSDEGSELSRIVRGVEES